MARKATTNELLDSVKFVLSSIFSENMFVSSTEISQYLFNVYGNNDAMTSKNDYITERYTNI